MHLAFCVLVFKFQHCQIAYLVAHPTNVRAGIIIHKIDFSVIVLNIVNPDVRYYFISEAQARVDIGGDSPLSTKAIRLVHCHAAFGE